jgi:predicted ferric reductase
MKTANQTISVLLGVLALLYGAACLISPAIVGGESARAFHVAHAMREQGAAGIFIGLMSFWCAINYEKRQSVHYCLMVFAFLLAAIHWFDYFSGHLRWISPVYNSVPFSVLLVMAVFGRIERRTRRSTIESDPH